MSRGEAVARDRDQRIALSAATDQWPQSLAKLVILSW